MSGIHRAITRIVREGKVAEIEEAIKRFVARSMGHYGTTGDEASVRIPDLSISHQCFYRDHR